MTDPEWDPTLHPKDKDGKFTHKGEGVYHYLKDLKYGSSMPGNVVAKAGKAGDIHQVGPYVSGKVGGVFVHAPTGEKVASIDYVIKPGEAVHPVTGTGNFLAVNHGTGQYSLLRPTPEGDATMKGFSGTKAEVEKHLAAKGMSMHSIPLDSNQGAGTVTAPPDGAPVQKNKLDVLPEGHQVHADFGATFTKTNKNLILGDQWVANQTGKTLPGSELAGLNAKLTHGPNPDLAKVQTGHEVKLVTSIHELEQMPAGAKIDWTSPGSALQTFEYTKQANGKWLRASDGKEFTTNGFHKIVFGGGVNGHIKTAGFEHVPAHAAPEDKIAAAIEKHASTPAKIEELHEPDPGHLHVPVSKMTPESGDSDGEVKGLADGSEIHYSPAKLVHSVSGIEMPLQPGDKIHQHNTVKTSFLVEHTNGNFTQVNSTGKVKKAPVNLVALKDQNYKQIHEVSQTVTVPGTGVQLKTGQSLYSSKGNPHYWAKVENGKVIDLVAKDGSEGKPAVLKNWQAALQKGTLVHLHTVSGEPSASTETLPGAVEPENVGPPGPPAPEPVHVPEPEVEEPVKPTLQEEPAPEPPVKTYETEVKLPKKAPAAKGVKAGPFAIYDGLPTEFKGPDFPSAKTVLPGQSIWEIPSGASKVYWKVNSDGKLAQSLNESGQPTGFLPNSKWTIKKLASVPGGKPVAFGGIKPEVTLPEGTATDLTEKEHIAAVNLGYMDHSVGFQNYPRQWYIAIQNDAKLVDENGQPQGYLGVLASQKFADMVADHLATMVKAKADHPDIEQKYKSKTTKAIGVARLELRAHLLALKLRDPNHDLTSQDEAELEEITSALQSLPSNWAARRTFEPLQHGFIEKKFAQSVKHLGFDPNNGTPEQYLKYVNGKGVAVGAGMTPEGLKQWTLADLGAPGTQQSAKIQIEKNAQAKLAAMAVIAKAAGVMAKKQALAPTPAEAETTKAVTAKLASMYGQIKKMHVAYAHEDGSAMNWNGEYGWTMTVPPSGPMALSDLQAVDAAHSPGWKSAGELIGSPADKIAKSLDVDYPGWQVADGQTLQMMGAPNALTLPPATRKAWLAAYLMSDQLGQYGAAIKAGAVPVTHPGSPETGTGIAARQALADYLATVDWYKKTPEGEEFTDPEKAAAELGLTEAYAHISGSKPSATQMMQLWASTHDTHHLPSPSGFAHTGPVAIHHGKHSVTVKPGELVAGSDDGNSLAVFGSKSWTRYTNSSPGGKAVDYEGGETQAFAHGDFVSAGNWYDLTPVWAPQPDAAQIKLPSKPSDVPQDAWDLTLGAEDGGQELKNLLGDVATQDSTEIEQQIMNLSNVDANTKLKMLSAPENLRRLAAWARARQIGYNHPADEKNLANGIVAALAARADAGEFTKPDLTQWTHPGSGKVFDLPPGSEVWQHSSSTGAYALVLEGGQTGWGIQASGGLSGLQPYQLTAYKGSKVAESLAELNPDKAAAEGWTISQGAWDALADAETLEGSAQTPEAGQAYALKAALATSSLLDKYNGLVAKVHALPPGVKTYLVDAATHGDSDKLDAALYKIGKGFYAQHATAVENPLVPPGKSYSQEVAAGHLSNDDIYTNWSYSDMSDFGHDYGLQVDGLSASQLAGDIAGKLADLKKTQALHPEEKLGNAANDTANLVLTKIGKKLSGMHTKQTYADQYAEEWMAKFFSSDPNREYRVEAEHYANVIGRLFGFNQPQTFVREMDGQYNYVQHLAPADGDLVGLGPKDLTEDQLANAMSEHILDWLLGNHDSHEENLLRAPDGKSIIGIDKGQAFKHHHDDKLAVGYLPPENGAPVWYDRFYKLVQQGKIDKALAEKVATRVLLKAYQVQQRHDERFHELMDAALAKKPKGGYAGYSAKFPNKAALEAGVMDRKHNLLKDFASFYEGMWKQAGWDWTINADDFGKKVGNAHVQNGPQFVSEVAEAKATGKALMFNSRDIDDAHLMFTPMQQKNGGSTLLGSGMIRSEADKLLTAWLKERVEGKLANGKTPQAAVPEEVAKPGAELPLIANMNQANVSYLKTVYTHATNGGKNPDGEYNGSTIASAIKTSGELQDLLEQVLEQRDNDPTKTHSKFSTLEQQDAWVEAAKQSLDEYEAVKSAHAQHTPVATLFPKKVPFKAFSYTPSPGLALNKGAGIVEKWELGSAAKNHEGYEFAVRTADGGHYVITTGGEKSWISPQDFGTLTSGNGPAKKIPLVSTDPAAKPGTASWTNSASGEKYVQNEAGNWSNADGDTFNTAQLDQKVGGNPDQWTWTDGSTVEEKSTEVQVAGKQFKVTHAHSASHSGAIDYKTGNMVETGNGPNKEFQTGTEYVVSYGNVAIRYRPWTEPGVAKSQQGALNFEVTDWDGTPAQVDDVLDTLSIMGLDVTPADQASLELHYWRHMLDIVEARGESKQPGTKYANALAQVKQAVAANPKMSDSEYLTVLKQAWAGILGGQEIVDKAEFAPQFAPALGDTTGGRPHWQRPDLDLASLKSAYGNGKWTPIHRVTGDAIQRAVKIIQTQGTLPSEERVRILGKLEGGASSHSDQGGNGQGSSAFTFNRQNVHPWSGNVGGPISFLVDPRVAWRSSNYASPEDSFGSINARASSPFEAKKMLAYSAGNNELMVKDGVVPVRYVAVQQDNLKPQLIAALKAAGIEDFNGIPLEQFVLTSSQWQEHMKKIWDEIEKEMGE